MTMLTCGGGGGRRDEQRYRRLLPLLLWRRYDGSATIGRERRGDIGTWINSKIVSNKSPRSSTWIAGHRVYHMTVSVCSEYITRSEYTEA